MGADHFQNSWNYVESRMIQVQLISVGLFLAILSVPIVPIKAYPFVFALVVLSIVALVGGKGSFRASRYRGVQVAVLLYLVLVVSSFLTNGGDFEFLLRTLVNCGLLLAVAYLRARQVDLSTIRFGVLYALKLALILSAAQVMYAVVIGGLWLHPFQVGSSDDAYLIQRVVDVVYGDLNKNIWATKSLLYFLSALILVDWNIRKLKGVAAITLFILVYTSSRTAQLAFVSYFVVWAAVLLGRRFRVPGGLLIGGVALLFVIALLFGGVSLPSVDLSRGHQGDGLLARFLLWNYFWERVEDFSIAEWVFGHGLLAVASFLSPVFEENNLHNVLLNQFYDLGLAGVLLTLNLWRRVFNLIEPSPERAGAVAAFVVICMSQYFGSDPEIVVLFCCVLLASSDPAARIARTVGPTGTVVLGSGGFRQ